MMILIVMRMMVNMTSYDKDIGNDSVCCDDTVDDSDDDNGHDDVRIYTERQKKLITSSGRRSLTSTLSKSIIFGHK